MQKSQIRYLVDSDIDQLVEDIGFDYNYIPEIEAKGLVLVDCYQRVKIVLFGNGHKIRLFRVLDESYAKHVADIFETYIMANKNIHYYCDLDERLTIEHIALKSVGFKCFQVKGPIYKFYLERNIDVT